MNDAEFITAVTTFLQDKIQQFNTDNPHKPVQEINVSISGNYISKPGSRFDYKTSITWGSETFFLG